ncbi:MAG TPA: type IV pilin [Methanosarcinaceae archaeon]|nr:type IV pilin [Methanosarcinaceae archaeon]
MVKSTKHLTQNCDAVSEVIGELLMTAIAVLAFGVIAVFMLSYQGPTSAPHVDIDGWVDVDTDSIYFRHSGGETIDTESLRIILNLNGNRRELSPDDVYSILGSNTWNLGDCIIINTSLWFNTSINETDNVGSTIVNGVKNVVIESGTLLGEEMDVTTLPSESDTTAPIINNVTNETPDATSVTITWNTSESSDSVVKYGTISGTYTLTQSSASDVTSHSIPLAGLIANTKYYFVVNSTDPSGNSAQSIEHNFTTASAVDITAPVISNIENGTPDTMSITITWDTDELSDSIVKYSNTSGSYDFTPSNVSNVISHSINLTGLTSGTQYYYVVNSTDPSDNSAQSSEYNFTTASVVGPSYTIFPPTSASDTSGGTATVGQVETDGDGLYTTYNIPKQSVYDEGVYQEFVFAPALTSDPTTVLIRIDHTATQTPTNAKIKVWEESTSMWHDEAITSTTIWKLDEVDVSAYIDTQADVNNLKVRYLSHVNGNSKIANIEYIAAYVE